MSIRKGLDEKAAGRRKMMKFTAASLLAAAAAPLLPVVRGSSADPILGLTRARAAENTGKTLIVYYSKTGNTRALAEKIRFIIGADMIELLPANPYPDDYKATTEQAKKELNSGYLPPLSNNIDSLGAYSFVLVGSPNWWSTLAMPVRTFLTEHNLAGKTVAPFITHGGGGSARCLEDLKGFCPNATVLDGLAVRGHQVGSSGDQVENWLRKLGLHA